MLRPLFSQNVKVRKRKRYAYNDANRRRRYVVDKINRFLLLLCHKKPLFYVYGASPLLAPCFEL